MTTLRDLLRQKGIRQRALAEKLGISEPSMSKWANRQTPIPAAAISPIAETLGVDVAEVLAVATPISAPAEAA